MLESKIYLGNCLDVMKDIPSKSIDAIICDLPYGTSSCKWDVVIPFDKLWESYSRVIKDDGAIVLFCQQPFTTLLIGSNIAMWKYNWVWRKENGTNFLNSKHQPLKVTEDIAVFSKSVVAPSARGNYMRYNPQMIVGATPYVAKRKERKPSAVTRTNIKSSVTIQDKGERWPVNLIEFKRDKEKFHPTQKPVDLLRYLIRTYTNEGDVVLDNCMGSGTTCVAAIMENRKYIGIELNEEYYKIAKDRIDKEKKSLKLF